MVTEAPISVSALLTQRQIKEPREPLSADETAAIEVLKKMLEKIAKVKEKHHRPALHPPAAMPVP
jgi:hypothetical protein